MKTTVRKWYWAWSYQEEEDWLNSMANKGWMLSDVGFCRYTFEEGGEKYIYRIELLENCPGHPNSMAYIRFLEETGAEYVGSVTRWVYFRRKAELGPFELYSDNTSKQRYIKRVLALLTPLSCLNLYCGLNNLSLFGMHGMTVNLLAALLNLAIGVTIGCGVWKVWKTLRALQKSDKLYE